ncbi:hypothetical protein HaLaN_21917 [Haematococcus lacustris]|uniref:Uncharacterized protein n=1 Tax=Haematococcus lacustris TaxID=44745 RepID=A0A699ZZF1_HAELA|nr:hypothetical protein HaLaN_21917 [Haematococcus lacustris]
MADTSALASVPKMPVRAKQRKPVHQKKPEWQPGGWRQQSRQPARGTQCEAEQQSGQQVVRHTGRRAGGQLGLGHSALPSAALHGVQGAGRLPGLQPCRLPAGVPPGVRAHRRLRTRRQCTQPCQLQPTLPDQHPIALAAMAWHGRHH